MESIFNVRQANPATVKNSNYWKCWKNPLLRWDGRCRDDAGKCCLSGILGGSERCKSCTGRGCLWQRESFQPKLKIQGRYSVLLCQCHLFYMIPRASVAIMQHMKGGCVEKQRRQRRDTEAPRSLKMSSEGGTIQPEDKQLLWQKSKLLTTLGITVRIQSYPNHPNWQRNP